MYAMSLCREKKHYARSHARRLLVYIANNTNKFCCFNSSSQGHLSSINFMIINSSNVGLYFTTWDKLYISWRGYFIFTWRMPEGTTALIYIHWIQVMGTKSSMCLSVNSYLGAREEYRKNKGRMLHITYLASIIMEFIDTIYCQLFVVAVIRLAV